MSKTADFYVELSELLSDVYKLSIDYNNILSNQSHLSQETLSSFKSELVKLGERSKSMLEDIGYTIDSEIYY